MAAVPSEPLGGISFSFRFVSGINTVSGPRHRDDNPSPTRASSRIFLCHPPRHRQQSHHFHRKYWTPHDSKMRHSPTCFAGTSVGSEPSVRFISTILVWSLLPFAIPITGSPTSPFSLVCQSSFTDLIPELLHHSTSLSFVTGLSRPAETKTDRKQNAPPGAIIETVGSRQKIIITFGSGYRVDIGHTTVVRRNTRMVEIDGIVVVGIAEDIEIRCFLPPRYTR